MADLDDFFAKKDRKKAKGKKFATTDEVAKKLEETGKRLEKPKLKEKPANPEGEESQHTEVRGEALAHGRARARVPLGRAAERVARLPLPCLFLVNVIWSARVEQPTARINRLVRTSLT